MTSLLRQSRLRLVAAFTVVVLGLAVVDALVLFAVEPQLQALRNIANDHARAVQVTTASARGSRARAGMPSPR
jgi:hypothetical protein